MMTYKVLVAHPAENRETVEYLFASSYAEALTMAERHFAGVEDVLIGIPVDAFDIARAEGIEFNEADGLLV